jgi:hypothetical protein
MKRLIRQSESVTELFDKVSKGEASFPENFWNGAAAKLKALQIVKYLLVTKMKWTENDIRDSLCVATFTSNKLDDMLQKVFEGNPYFAVKSIFPKIKPWEFKRFKGVTEWTDDLTKQAIKWLVEDKLGYKSAAEIRKVKSTDFFNNGLTELLRDKFGSNPIKALSLVYPNIFIQEEQKLKQDQQSEEWKSVVDNRKKKAPSKKPPRKDPRSSDSKRIEDPIILYEEIQKGNILKFPVFVWEKPENGPILTKYMIENLLGWNDDQIKNQLTAKTFVDHRLGDMLDTLYQGDVYKAVNAAYPGRFNPEDFGQPVGNLASKKNRLIKKN